MSGIDITGPFVEAGRKLTGLVGLDEQVEIVQGDAQRLPYGDPVFDGAYTQHVTMNVADRAGVFAEAWRVLKPGGFFALTEHGLGPTGEPLHPVPWSEDGSGEWLVTPAHTRALLDAAGFVEIEVEDTGPEYLEAYRRVLAIAEQEPPPLGTHLLLGENAQVKVQNAARNIEEGRTRPIRVLCRKPA